MAATSRTFARISQPFKSSINTHVCALSTSSVNQSKRLDGKVAIVTASTEGIGLAIAKDLGKNGAKVVISSRKEENVSNAIESLAKEGIDVKGVVCHVSKPEHRENLVNYTLKEYGSIDVLISNAAANPVFGPILDTNEDAWDKILDVNVKSSFFLAKSCIEHMQKKGGSIVFISSIAGFLPMPGLGAYSVSKTALFGLTKALSVECAPMNIRVNCVSPGVIKTKFSSALWSSERILKSAMKQIPLQRIGEPEDVSGLVTFLASDESKYITGENIVASGGMPSRL
ncbi:dehydrogenase/reductase SDR family member 4-like [Rhopilema esculentum]|uniref:dehydrogenase/reductase SDR family member 4-like n=1 Tax=Rhopilema esculentum TaxID=499914 RepID=UPI0031CE8D4A